MAVQTVIKKRRDTAANWLSVNPTLAAGEEGYETDTGLSKIGNATDAWVDLDYVSIAVVKEKVKNSTGSTIAKGAVVYISGANGDNALVSLADADGETTSSKTLGLASAAIADGAIGTITTNGFLEGINTSSATAGQSVWLSSTPGGFVFGNPPAKPAHSVYLGVVTRAHATQGAILVKVQNGYELEELHNVTITNPVTGDVLTYDGVSGQWINSEGGTGSASITVSDTAPVDPTADSMWFNSAEASAYIYYDSTWVPLNPGIAGPAGPTGIIVSDTAPTNTAQLWADPNATGSYIVPANGSKGQILAKITDTSYDTGWVTPQGSGNVLINGAFDIWQRGTSFSLTGVGIYTADRWNTPANENGGVISQQAFTPGSSPVPGYDGTYYLRYIKGGTTADKMFISQRIEDVKKLAGQTVTLSYWMKGSADFTNEPLIQQSFGSGGSSDVYTTTATQNITTSWARYSVTFVIPSVSGKTIGANSYAAIWPLRYTGTSNITAEIWGVQLEAGSIATPFRRNAPSIQAELAACQRYYWRVAGDNWRLPMGLATSTTAAFGSFMHPVTMRSKISSIDYSGFGQASGQISWNDINATYNTTGVAISTIESSTIQSCLYTTGMTGLTAYRPMFLGGNGGTAYLGFSAEL